MTPVLSEDVPLPYIDPGLDEQHILRYAVLAAEYICIHLLYPRHYHCCVQMWVFLPPRDVLLRKHYRQTKGYPIVESTKVPPYPGGRHSVLRTKQEFHLKYCLVKKSRGPGVCSLPPQNNGEMCPSTPSIPEIINHFRPVTNRCSKDLSKLFKCHHRLLRSPVGPEVHCSALLCLLLPHPIKFPLCPLGAYHCGLMIPVHQPSENNCNSIRLAQ